MKLKTSTATILLLILITSALFSCKTAIEKKYSSFMASSEAFTYSGRTEMLNDTTQALISSAAQVFFNAESDSITFLLNSEGDLTSYAVIELNGKYHSRFKVFSDSLNRISIPLPQDKINEIGLFKATEASNGALLFYGVEAKSIAATELKTDYTIEYIGDSITCGFGADNEESPCNDGTWYDGHNAYLAYGPIAARSINAEYWLSSVSGMGIYRNWNDEDTNPIMGDVYATTYLNGSTDKNWKFTNKSPDIVSICLGTNDLSNGDGIKERKPFDAEKFTTNYTSLVKEVFENYPNTKLALLTSPMVSVENNAILLSCLKRVKAEFEAKHTVAIYEFRPMKPNGCDAHPDLKDHVVMAEQLIPFYTDLLTKH